MHVNNNFQKKASTSSFFTHVVKINLQITSELTSHSDVFLLERNGQNPQDNGVTEGIRGLWGTSGPASLLAGSKLSAGKDPTLERALLTNSGIIQCDKAEPRKREQVKTNLRAILLCDKEVSSKRMGSKLPVCQHLVFAATQSAAGFQNIPVLGLSPLSFTPR